MLATDADLATLVKNKDHLNVLCYIRVHQLREPDLVLAHGRALFGPNLDKRGGTSTDDLARMSALAQICLAALDVGQPDVANLCLTRLKESHVPNESTRFRCLLARCLEAAGDYAGAELIYDELLKENPANLVSLKRKYCILRAQVGKHVEAMEALNKYLEQNLSDTAAWYEMAQYRSSMGDYKGSAFALEEVLLATPLASRIHCELAECYATIGGIENLGLARKHMAQCLELDPTDRRGLFGLISVANDYLIEASTSKKEPDDHETSVAEELVRFGVKQLLEAYSGTDMFTAVKDLMNEYSEGL
jgi:tetratricopeptide (TPR) repeat protein